MGTHYTDSIFLSERALWTAGRFGAPGCEQRTLQGNQQQLLAGECQTDHDGPAAIPGAALLFSCASFVSKLRCAGPCFSWEYQREFTTFQSVKNVMTSPIS